VYVYMYERASGKLKYKMANLEREDNAIRVR